MSLKTIIQFIAETEAQLLRPLLEYRKAIYRAIPDAVREDWDLFLPSRPTPEDIEDTVTLLQASGMCRKSKKTLEHLLARGRLPKPNFPSPGRGKPHRWKWTTLRPALERELGLTLPDRMPSLHGFKKLSEM